MKIIAINLKKDGILQVSSGEKEGRSCKQINFDAMFLDWFRLGIEFQPLNFFDKQKPCYLANPTDHS